MQTVTLLISAQSHCSDTSPLKYLSSRTRTGKV